MALVKKARSIGAETGEAPLNLRLVVTNESFPYIDESAHRLDQSEAPASREEE